MANQSTFPTTLDGTPTDVGSGDTILSSAWNQYMDAIDQLEIKVGIDSSAVTTSVDYQIKTLPPAGIKSRVVQVVNIMNVNVVTGTTLIPYDDTIPQVTEGNQILSASFTPTNASNVLLITSTINVDHTVNAAICMALFATGSTNARACTFSYSDASQYIIENLEYYMVAGTTDAIVFQVRAAGHAAGTTTFNGSNSARKYGGAATCSMTITEIAV